MEDRDRRRLLKLLALTSSPNEAEARLASQRAQELLKRLGLTWADVISSGPVSAATSRPHGPDPGARPAAKPRHPEPGAPAEAASPGGRVRRSMFWGFLQWVDDRADARSPVDDADASPAPEPWRAEDPFWLKPPYTRLGEDGNLEWNAPRPASMLTGIQRFGFLCWYVGLAIGALMALFILRVAYGDDTYTPPLFSTFVGVALVFGIPAIIGRALRFLFAGR
jgi:hypothetical protein